MKLYLARHGEAVPSEINPDCPLSDNGDADIKKLAAFLSNGGVRVARVFHSGKTRARQTAEILARSIAPDADIETLGGLKPMDSVKPVADKAAGWREDTLLVGHLPFMGILLALLVTGVVENDVAEFSGGAIACLKRDGEGDFTLSWMVDPALLGN